MADKKSNVSAVETPHFTKAQFMSANKYAGRKDLVGALLDEKTEYTTEQVDELIEKYLKGKVN